MADYASLRTMMVNTQVRPSDVTKFPVIQAMLSVPREKFVPRNKRDAAYIGENVEFGAGRVELEPRTIAKMLDALDVQPDELVLHIGANLGYAPAVIGMMAEAVIAVEDDSSNADEAQNLLSEIGADNVVIHAGGLTEGAAKHGPYDAIFINGAIEQLPQALADQLKDGGRIVAIFADGHLGTVRIGYKLDGRINWRHAFNAGAPLLAGFEKRSEFTL